MDQLERRSLSVLVDNEAGVLSQVSRMWTSGTSGTSGQILHNHCHLDKINYLCINP